jgi:nitrate/nitrite transporter NarK
MEGTFTCLLGIGSYFIIVDFPEDSPKSWNFLNKAEAAFVVARIEHDRSDTFAEPFTVKGYFRNALDSKVWAFAWLYMMTTTCSYSIAYFLPIILLDGMGFSTAKAQCLVAPPYIAAGIVMAFQAWLADRMRLRGPTIVFNALMGMLAKIRFRVDLTNNH